MAFGVCTNCFSSLQFFFDIVATHNDEICYVKHFLDPLCVFFTLFGCVCGGGSQGG